MVLTNDTIAEYKGEKDKERLWRMVLKNGTIQEFEGEKDEERLVSVETPHYFIKYKGPKGGEYMVSMRRANGTLFYEKPRAGQGQRGRAKRFESSQGFALFADDETVVLNNTTPEDAHPITPRPPGGRRANRTQPDAARVPQPAFH